MIVKKGIGVSPGVGIGPAFVLENEEFDVPERHVPADRAPAELTRLKQAIAVAKKDVRSLQNETASRMGKETAAIFDFHAGLLSDATLSAKFSDLILKNHVTAEFAVADVLRDYAREFLAMPEYLADRVRDVYDIEKRLLRNLIGQQQQTLHHLNSDRCILAHDLTPSQTAGADRTHVRGLAIDAGGRTSHTAILARTLGIPAVVGLNDVTATAQSGMTVIIDGTRGIVVLDPDAKTVAQYQSYQQRQVAYIHSLDELKDLPATTRDGHDVVLLGNIEFPEESQIVLNRGGQGIGLYRTEFLYLGSNVVPSEDDQYRAYRHVLECCGDRPVVIRTLDLGADKFTQSRARIPERNPFLGLRSIRLSLQDIPMFKTQLRAILRASVEGQASVMFPLVTSLLELRQAKAIVRDVAEDLEEEGLPHKADIPIGVMIETPAAALQCQQFAKEVDFFSIGSNDLAQYTLAVDRGNERVASLFTMAHPSIIRLIKQIIRAGGRYDVRVSLCGEMAGDPQYTMLLLGLGLRVFSCAPGAIPEIKKLIRSVTMAHAEQVARRVLTFESETEIVSYLRAETRKVLPEVISD
ncbi:MAG: phosphoenolpyruvate--protein phosphotransferase [Planctomycetota bacterium]|nr:phosphoenolpyruvate--protein phosphotransferase [Planctomycetota bacterium]